MIFSLFILFLKNLVIKDDIGTTDIKVGDNINIIDNGMNLRRNGSITFSAGFNTITINVIKAVVTTMPIEIRVATAIILIKLDIINTRLFVNIIFPQHLLL